MGKRLYRAKVRGSQWFHYDDPALFDVSAVYRSNIVHNSEPWNELYVHSVGYHYRNADRHYANHTTKRFKLVFVLEGSGWFNGLPVKAGQGFLLWENHINSITADISTPWGYIFISFSGTCAELLVRKAGFTPEDSVFDISDIDEVKNACYSVIYRKDPSRDHDMSLTAVLFRALAVKRTHITATSAQLTEITPMINVHVANAIQFMNANYKTPITVQDVANAVYISGKYLRELFKKEMGRSVQQYLTWLRLGSAKMLLAGTEYTISEAAMLSGFKEYRNFVRLFKTRFGITPSEYREKEHRRRARALAQSDEHTPKPAQDD